MATKSIKTPLELGHSYHIYNRGNNKEKLFLRAEHYEYFLLKYREIIHPSVSTFAYCLMPNHFHFLIRIDRNDSKSSIDDPSHLFRRFFQQYSIWFNKKEARKGSLFTKYFRRIEVQDERYLKRLVYYIHRNPQKHGICNDFIKYPYSSFGHFNTYNETFIERKEVLSWFDNDLTEFLVYHNVIEEAPEFAQFFIDDPE